MTKPRILYALCGTGQGHMTKAMSLMPEIKERYDVEYLVSGLNNPLLFEVDHVLDGATFQFKDGKVDIPSTFRSLNVENMFKEITNTKLSDYEFIINDHEPITSYASYYLNYRKIYTISHQASFAFAQTPRPEWSLKKVPERLLAEYVLGSYAKNASSRSFGLHFRKYHENIMYPVLRPEILDMKPVREGTCLVYLPKEAPSELLKVFSQFENQKFTVFDPKLKTDVDEYDNVTFKKTDNKEFLKTLETCSYGIVNAGFELPSEMMYLKKNLMTLPQRGQYEQECNAAALKEIGVQVEKEITYENIEKFLASSRKNVLQPISRPSEVLDVIEEAHRRTT